MLKKISSYFFDEVDPLPIFILRVTIGFIYFSHYITHATSFIPIYSWNGIAGAYKATPNLQYDLLYWLIYALILISSIALILGFWTKTSLVFSTLGHLFFLITCPGAYWGWGSAILYYSYILLFCNPGSILSLDKKLKKDHSPPPGVRAWKLRLVQWLTCSIYLTVNLYRIGSQTWTDGTALQNGLSNVLLGRFPNAPWSHISELLIFLTFFTLFIEGLASILVFLGRFQKYVLILLYPFHLFTELLMTVGYWQFLMPAAESSFFPQSWSRKFYEFFKLKKPQLKSKIPTKYDIWGVVIGFTIWFMCFTTGIPKRMGAPWFWKFQYYEYKVLAHFHLSHFSHFNLFDRPHSTFAYCVAVLGHEPDKQTSLIYKSDLSDCMTGNFRFNVEHIRNTLYEFDRYYLSYINQGTREISYNHLGNYFCADPFSKGKRSFSKVDYGILKDVSRNDRETTPNRNNFDVLFSYDCSKKVLLPTNEKDFRDFLKRDHSDYFKVIESKGF